MTDQDLPLPRLSEVQERVDMQWLFELMETERLRPDALVEADKDWSQVQRELAAILDECNHKDGKKLLLQHDDLAGESFRLCSEFWLRLGMVLGMKHMWGKAGLHRGGTLADILQLTGEMDEYFAPSDYLSAVLSARDAMQQAQQIGGTR